MEQNLIEQSLIRVSFPLRYKLLLAVVTLILIVIGFLTISTTILIEKDKRAYTYILQGTEAQLAGKEFSNLISKTVDHLKLMFAKASPGVPANSSQLESIRGILNNQESIQAVQLGLLQRQTARLKTLGFLTKPDAAKLDYQIAEGWLSHLIPVLTEKNFVIFNFSKPGQTPMIAVVLVDRGYTSNPDALAVMIGYSSIETFTKEPRESMISIANSLGDILVDTDPSLLFGRSRMTDDPLFQTAEKTQIAAGSMEFSVENIPYIGSYYKPGFDVTVLARTKWRKAMAPFYSLLEKFILFGLVAIGFAIISAIFFARNLTRPLSQLYLATKKVAEGNFELKLKINGKDELAALSTSFNLMSEKILNLIRESIEKVRLENELSIASTVQQTLIPPPKVQDENVFIRSFYQSASVCGGDWWGYLSVPGKMGLFISDATGHGLPSALITASARSCVSMIQKLAQEKKDFQLSPGNLLSYANRVVFDAASGRILMTFFAGVIDFESRTLTYASAGHNPPWLFQKNGDKYEMKSLTSRGNRLGELYDVPAFEEKTVPIQVDDVLFLYTDGIIEGSNKQGDMYSKKRLRKILEATVANGPEEMIGRLITDFSKHNERKPLDDDITVAAVKVLI